MRSYLKDPVQRHEGFHLIEQKKPIHSFELSPPQKNEVSIIYNLS